MILGQSSTPDRTARCKHRPSGDDQRRAPAPDGRREPAEADGSDLKRQVAELRSRVETLEAELERARGVLDSATGYAVVTMNLGGQITSWNAGARAILGYDAAEIIGCSGEVFFPAEDRARRVFAGELRRAMEEGSARNERWHLRCDGSRFWASGAMMPLLDAEGCVEGFLNVFRDGTALRAEEERRALLLAEMSHRTKNTFATVQAVAAQTLRSAGVAQEVQEAFASRLLALACSHELLTFGDAEGAPLIEVLQRALSPYGGAERTSLAGPPVRLPASGVEMLGLGFHELATNAAKYGALSVPDGRVDVEWSLRRTRNGTALVEIVWREHGGPPVTAPSRRGFGTKLLERGLMQDVGGTVKLAFRPEGVECRICLPVGLEAS